MKFTLAFVLVVVSVVVTLTVANPAGDNDLTRSDKQSADVAVFLQAKEDPSILCRIKGEGCGPCSDGSCPCGGPGQRECCCSGFCGGVPPGGAWGWCT